jgi:SAM-dependent methyltransferase
MYTHGHHESVLRSHRWRTAENSAAYLLPHLKPGLSLLDIGCGPGTITADLAELVAPGEVVAADITPEALAVARRTIKAPNVSFAEADVLALDFPDGSFDIVHAHQVLQHVGDPVRALREMKRVCRPGGLVAARDGDYSGFAWYPEKGLKEWLDLYRRIARGNGGEPDAGRRLLNWARAAGFTEVAATSSTWCFATPEDRDWWGGLWADRMTKSAIADQARALGEDVDAIAKAWRDWAAEEDGWFSVLHGEILARA